MKPKRVFALGILIGLLAGTVLVQGQTVKRRYINLPGRTDQLPFSSGIQVGNVLYLAGTLGVDPTSRKVPDDLEQEVRFALDEMKATLAEADMTMEDLVTVQVFCTDLSLYDRFNAVYRTYFNKNFPARAFIGVRSLLLGGHFEIQGIAVKQ